MRNEWLFSAAMRQTSSRGYVPRWRDYFDMNQFTSRMG